MRDNFSVQFHCRFLSKRFASYLKKGLSDLDSVVSAAVVGHGIPTVAAFRFRLPIIYAVAFGQQKAVGFDHRNHDGEGNPFVVGGNRSERSYQQGHGGFHNHRAVQKETRAFQIGYVKVAIVAETAGVVAGLITMPCRTADNEAVEHFVAVDFPIIGLPLTAT